MGQWFDEIPDEAMAEWILEQSERGTPDRPRSLLMTRCFSAADALSISSRSLAEMFFVATAPLSGQGHVNVSPKGRPSFYLEGKRACWYCDMTGSGGCGVIPCREPLTRPTR